MPGIQDYLSQLNNGVPNSDIPQSIQTPRPQMVGNGLSQLANQQPQLEQLYRQYMADSHAMGQQPVPIEQFMQMIQQ